MIWDKCAGSVGRDGKAGESQTTVTFYGATKLWRGGDNPREGTLKLKQEYLVYRHTGCAFGIKSHLMIANCKGHLIHILLHKMCEIQTTINFYAATKLWRGVRDNMREGTLKLKQEYIPALYFCIYVLLFFMIQNSYIFIFFSSFRMTDRLGRVINQDNKRGAERKETLRSVDSETRSLYVGRKTGKRRILRKKGTWAFQLYWAGHPFVP